MLLRLSIASRRYMDGYICSYMIPSPMVGTSTPRLSCGVVRDLGLLGVPPRLWCGVVRGLGLVLQQKYAQSQGFGIFGRRGERGGGGD